MNNIGRENFVLMFIVLAIGMMVFVGAVGWKAGADSTNYTTSEGSVYYYNFTELTQGYEELV